MTPTPPASAPGSPGFTLGHRIPPPSGDYHWVYLWDWPIRAMHWIAVLCILTLAVTGLYIGMPFFITGGDTQNHFLMGWVRFVHFAAAAFLVMTAIVRFYWLFAGNKFERLRALFPLRPRDWVNMWKQIKYYLMIEPDRAPKYLGHNPLQQLSYTLLYGTAAIMVITGFAMYGQYNPSGFFYHVFNWVVILFGGLPIVHFVHHVLTWVFLIFIPIHVYLAIRADNVERTGTISSIVSGGRFVPSKENYIDGADA
ncbi:MAG TPA: Ni/Fe-hydrogenase, b-type cytochrome subunit [Gemmatimonadales bacterium]|nr:Ni/Fe-hydrogenase, b-type cytochrome subunit [Gemmatimonadales bacterium]